jgi:uncharacterized membrane protein
MSIAQLAPSVSPRGASRWLLLGSLALNLFFVGVAAAEAVRAPAPSSSWDRNVFVRVERLATTLAPSDASSLWVWIDVNRTAIQDSQTIYRAAQDQARAVLRREPFNVVALRAAMANTRAARQNFDQIIEEILATAAAQMSPAGR